MKTILTAFLYFTFTVIAFAQKDQTEGHIMWSEDRQLTWDDFGGKAKKNHFASAMSDITFSVKINSEGNKLMIYVRPSFNPKGSWVKPEDKTDYLLKHEQIHFDIYEVNARKLRQELQTKKLTNTNSQSILNQLVNKYSELNVKTQDRYDEETEHSIKTDKQEKWNAKIEEELKSLEEYKAYEFVVKIN